MKGDANNELDDVIQVSCLFHAGHQQTLINACASCHPNSEDDSTLFLMLPLRRCFYSLLVGFAAKADANLPSCLRACAFVIVCPCDATIWSTIYDTIIPTVDNAIPSAQCTALKSTYESTIHSTLYMSFCSAVKSTISGTKHPADSRAIQSA